LNDRFTKDTADKTGMSERTALHRGSDNARKRLSWRPLSFLAKATELAILVVAQPQTAH
jgi:hypothetical protein